MRYSAEHKQETRKRILNAAARQFREQGFAETGVAAVMKAANLTHGGFYAHFENKDALIAEVIRGGFSRVSENFESQFDHLSGNEWLREWVHRYLSDEHFEHTAQGCPLPSLTSEIARSGPEARAAFTNMFYERLEKAASHVDAPEEEAKSRVLAAISQMAGAMMLARAVDPPLDKAVRDAAAREAYATLVGKKAPKNPDQKGSAK